MKFYIKSYEEIKKSGKDLGAVVPEMKPYCGKGPFYFKKALYSNCEWYRGVGWNWHKSWLIPIIENGQYLLKFER